MGVGGFRSSERYPVAAQPVLLSAKVFEDEAFKESVRNRFADDITRCYLGFVEEAELGLTDAELARRIGVNRGQFTRYRSSAKQQPSLRSFCLRSAAANAGYPDGAVIAFAAYCEAFQAVALQMERVAKPITPEIACCLYFGFRRLRAEMAAGRCELTDQVCQEVILDVREYFPKMPLVRTSVEAFYRDFSHNPLGTVSRDLPAKVPFVTTLASYSVSPPTVHTPEQLREALKGRVEIWANVVFVIGLPNDWF